MSNHNSSKDKIKKIILDSVNSRILTRVSLYSICKEVFSICNIIEYESTLSAIYQVLDTLVKEKQVTFNKEKDLCAIAYYTLNTLIKKAKNIQKELIMSRYTSDDNRSMQLNPENDRYWSSRGYCDDDYDDDYESNIFNLKDWKKKKEEEYKALKEKIHDMSIHAFNKKIIFKKLNHAGHPIQSIEWFFENILKEKDSLNIVSGVTVKTKSFKRFFIEILDSKKLDNDSEYCSFNFVKDLFKGGLGNLSKDVQENYVYFSRVTFSDSYVIFEIDTADQGFTRYNIWNSSYSWAWSCSSCGLRVQRPKVVYENFKNIFKRNPTTIINNY